MSGINTGKVITGGLAAGVVMNVIDFLANMLLASDFAANTARLGLDPAVAESTTAMATWVVVDLLMGVVVVFLYAAMRPRFGAGPRTASVSGIMIWLPVSLVLYGFATMGMLDAPVYWKATAISLLNALVSANVGGWLYKEA